MRVSTHTLQAAMLGHATRAQGAAVAAQTEMATGRLADPGATLGARTARLAALDASAQDLRELRDANGLLGTELDAMQGALGGLGEAADALAGDLLAALAAPSAATLALAAGAGASLLATAVGRANARLGDVHLFGGTRTHDAPLADPGTHAPARDLLADAFEARFGHPVGDPATASIDGAAMADFLAGLEADFPALYEARWAGPPPPGRTARILPGEHVAVPLTAHDPAVRDLVLATSLAAALADAPLGAPAREAVLTRGVEIAGRAGARSAQAAGRIGGISERLARADDTLAARIAVAETARADLVAVDATEAAGRVRALAARIEASLAVTARIGRLSLLDYL